MRLDPLRLHPLLPTVLVAVIVAIATAACTIAPESSPRDVAAEEQALLVADAIPVGESTGTERIYLVAPPGSGQLRQLRSVQRDVVEPETLLGVLLNGPNQSELDSRLITHIPSSTELLSPPWRVDETLFVDVSEEILELTGEAFTLAVAQLVFTASELPGIQSVRLQVNGADQAWPRGDGQARPGHLRTFDFPGFVESSQPAYPAVPAT